MLKKTDWISIHDQLPADGQRVLAYIEGNAVFLPGKTGETELREVIVLHFNFNFFIHDNEKLQKHGPHFWKGEGNSNHYFQSVSHWIPIPTMEK